MAEDKASDVPNTQELSLVQELNPRLPKEMPILPLADSVLLPSTIVPITINSPDLQRVIDKAMSMDRLLGVFSIRNPEGKETPIAGMRHLYDVGTAAKIQRLMKVDDSTTNVLLQGISKIRLQRIRREDALYISRVEAVDESHMNRAKDKYSEAMMQTLKKKFLEINALLPDMPESLNAAVASLNEPLKLVYQLTSLIASLSLSDKQAILQARTLKRKFDLLNSSISHESEILRIRSKIEKETQVKLDEAQRKYILREQLGIIRRELGEEPDEQRLIEQLTEKAEGGQLPDEAKSAALREIDRLAQVPTASPEYSTILSYLDTLFAIPWSVDSEDPLNIRRVENILNQDHYDLEEVKERILEFLAVRQNSGQNRGPILCFLGPPGVGKTSLGMSIARALGRKFYRMSLGGLSDEAEIRGHRRTYIGAMPGRIIQGIIRTGTMNPVFMLDEIDKLGRDFKGDPSSALLEVLDPNQNQHFMDNYIGVPVDLSKTMFIATANLTDTIQPALFDRMEIITIPGYLLEDKIAISNRYLIPQQRKEKGLTKKQVTISDGALKVIIENYTAEAGVRNLTRMIAKILRKRVREWLEGRKRKIRVTRKKLEHYLGQPWHILETRMRKPRVGVATGLAWTSVGGELLFLEAITLSGSRDLYLTGQIGEVMQESARAAISCLRSRAADYGIPPTFFSENEIHIHVPKGAVPKDGPSAGITMAVAMLSAIGKIPISQNVAMTGEITLSGSVLPVGGIREKVLAAKRAKIKHVVLPISNQKDISEIPKKLLQGITLHYVDTIEEVFDAVFKFSKSGRGKNTASIKRPASKSVEQRETKN